MSIYILNSFAKARFQFDNVIHDFQAEEIISQNNIKTFFFNTKSLVVDGIQPMIQSIFDQPKFRQIINTFQRGAPQICSKKLNRTRAERRYKLHIRRLREIRSQRRNNIGIQSHINNYNQDLSYQKQATQKNFDHKSSIVLSPYIPLLNKTKYMHPKLRRNKKNNYKQVKLDINKIKIIGKRRNNWLSDYIGDLLNIWSHHHHKTEEISTKKVSVPDKREVNKIKPEQTIESSKGSRWLTMMNVSFDDHIWGLSIMAALHVLF